MQLPIFPPVGPTSRDGAERSKPSGEPPTSHKSGDGFLRAFGGMQPGMLREHELGSDPTMEPRRFADREASGPIRAPGDPAFSLEKNPENTSAARQSPASPDLAKSATYTPQEADAGDAEPESIASARQGFGAQGLREFRRGSVGSEAPGNAAKPDSKFDPGHNSAFVSRSGLVSSFSPDSATDLAGAARGEHRETDKLPHNPAFSTATTATIPTPAEIQNFGDSRSDAVATMGVVLPPEEGHEIDNAAAILSDIDRETNEQNQAVSLEPFVPDPLKNAPKPDSKFDPEPNSALVSGAGFVSELDLDSATGRAGAVQIGHRETDELPHDVAFSTATTATIPMSAEAQNFGDSRSNAVATMGVVLPLEDDREIDNAAAILSDIDQDTIEQNQAVRLVPFVPDPLKNAPQPDSKFDPEPNSALVSGAGFVSELDLDSTTRPAGAAEVANWGEAGPGAEAATRVTRPLKQGESVKIATATVSGDELETTARKQASGPSALVAGAPELPLSGQGASTRTKAENRGPRTALSHNLARGTPANSAAPSVAVSAPRTGEAGSQQADRAASSIGASTDTVHIEARATASPSGSISASGRAPLEKSLPLATGAVEDRSVGSKGMKSGLMPQAGDNPNTGPVAASPEAHGGSAQGATLGIQMPRSDQETETLMPPRGKRSLGAATLTTSLLTPTLSGRTPSLPDGYAQMRGVGVEAKSDRTPATIELSAQSGGHTGSGVQISAPQAPGGIAAQSAASGTAASPLLFTVLADDPSGTEKRRSLEPEAALAEVRGTSTPTISTGSAPAVTPHHETARAVMVQLAHSIRANADRAIELRLHPEELGHVRMTFSTDHGGLSVALTADRSETLDLLRRNIDTLGEELRRIGYGTVDFSFGDDSHQRGGEAEPWSSGEASGALPESNPDHDHTEETKARATRGLARAHGGVDMRI